ncbi:hypothetical protein QBC46DRAFT_406296 [Diplogelasinospora grovesii]|uniref:SRPBCC domain-containing protein n=1 Tax=Diplogelasinospora grovesii TaxID=303347 RepID=A0AAN6NF49_9PEZI|nr:hypothetical protein QBC46DRAFT_406296 [Diplogelasinospora grovesii]
MTSPTISTSGTRAVVRVELEIAASPEQVRAVFLDLERYKEWHTSFITCIEPLPIPSTDDSDEPCNSPAIRAGDKIKVHAGGVEIEPTVLVNTPSEFRWFGSTMGGAFAGEHYFIFAETETGGTKFVHGEDYTGWLTFLFRPGWPLHNHTRELYAGFARDLKARVERLP